MISSCCDPSLGIKSVSVDFANTVECGACRVGDGLATEAEARRWILSRTGLLGPWKGPVPLAELLRLRAVIRRLFDAAVGGTAPRADDLREVNRLCRLSPTYSALTWRSPARSVRTLSLARNPRVALLTKLATCTVATLGDLDEGKLRRCEGKGCNHFLISRTAQQRWCSTTGCGNRARAARHYKGVKARKSALRAIGTGSRSAPRYRTPALPA